MSILKAYGDAVVSISDFRKAAVQNKAIVSMSECSVEYAKDKVPFIEVNGIPVKHLSWSKILKLAAGN